MSPAAVGRTAAATPPAGEANKAVAGSAAVDEAATDASEPRPEDIVRSPDDDESAAAVSEARSEPEEPQGAAPDPAPSADEPASAPEEDDLLPNDLEDDGESADEPLASADPDPKPGQRSD
jgi:hypothetical protein